MLHNSLKHKNISVNDVIKIKCLRFAKYNIFKDDKNATFYGESFYRCKKKVKQMYSLNRELF